MAGVSLAPGCMGVEDGSKTFVGCYINGTMLPSCGTSSSCIAVEIVVYEFGIVFGYPHPTWPMQVVLTFK